MKVNNPTKHTLKSWPAYFQATLEGRKTFELRSNENHYSVGDEIQLREWDASANRYTGRELLVRVTFVLTSVEIANLLGSGQSEVVVMSIEPVRTNG